MGGMRISTRYSATMRSRKEAALKKPGICWVSRLNPLRAIPTDVFVNYFDELLNGSNLPVPKIKNRSLATRRSLRTPLYQASTRHVTSIEPIWHRASVRAIFAIDSAHRDGSAPQTNLCCCLPSRLPRPTWYLQGLRPAVCSLSK